MADWDARLVDKLLAAEAWFPSVPTRTKLGERAARAALGSYYPGYLRDDPRV